MDIKECEKCRYDLKKPPAHHMTVAEQRKFHTLFHELIAFLEGGENTVKWNSSYPFMVPTQAGPLLLSYRDSAVYGKFIETEKAISALGVSPLAHGLGRTGKWNFHFGRPYGAVEAMHQMVLDLKAVAHKDMDDFAYLGG